MAPFGNSKLQPLTVISLYWRKHRGLFRLNPLLNLPGPTGPDSSRVEPGGPDHAASEPEALTPLSEHYIQVGLSYSNPQASETRS